MLGKLIKYEFKATARLLLPLLICMLVVGILGGGLANIQARLVEKQFPGSFDKFFDEVRAFFVPAPGTGEDYMENTAPEASVLSAQYDDPITEDQITDKEATAASLLMIFVSVVTGLLLMLMFALMCCSLVVTLLLGYRFYKNMFSDEGYLTFTLPVTATQNLWAKLITGSVWQIVFLLVSFLSVAFIFIGGIGTNPIVNTQNLAMTVSGILGQMFNVPAEYQASLGLFFGEGLLNLIIGIPAGLLIVYLAITLGCQIAQKHKVAASIGMYFAVSAIHAILSYVIQVVVMLPASALFYDNYLVYMNVNMLPGLLLSVISVAVCFPWIRYIMKNKLNLE